MAMMGAVLLRDKGGDEQSDMVAKFREMGVPEDDLASMLEWATGRDAPHDDSTTSTTTAKRPALQRQEFQAVEPASKIKISGGSDMLGRILRCLAFFTRSTDIVESVLVEFFELNEGAVSLVL
jgi:hypothetical protein